MGKPCVCGAEEVTVDLKDESFRVGDIVVRKGEVITVDGSSGSVYQGALALLEAEATPELAKLLSWADEAKQIGVWGNADTAEGVALAKKHGAEGIGLCRTERQFTGKLRLAAIRDFILSDSEEEEEKALANLRKLQKSDFLSLFKALGDTPVIIRLLDLPLHEFLPVEKDTDDPKLKRRLEDLQEVNPMLGHRGVRLAVTTPLVYAMQVEAIAEAQAETGARVSIMVPQVITLQELLWVKKHIEGKGFRIGIMMETVRACMRAAPLAEEASFFSFGTNDLTQAVYSFSREDAEKKVPHHLPRKQPPRRQPFRNYRRQGRGSAHGNGYWLGPRREAQPGNRRLRRTCRRAPLHPLLPRCRCQLRKLQPLPHPHSQANRRPGRHPQPPPLTP